LADSFPVRLEGGLCILGILTVVVYLFGAVLLLVVLLCLLFLLVPIKYKFDGGYEQSLQVNISVRLIALLTVVATWDSGRSKPGRVKIIIAGLSFELHPERWGKEDQKPEEKDQAGPPFGRVFLHGFDRELLGNGLALVVDMLKILRPEKIALRGKIGFDEPHLTGWLTAVSYLVKGFCKEAEFVFEPIWHYEYYEINLEVEGKIVSVLILFRAVRFILSRRTRQFFKMLKQEKLRYAA